MRKLEAVKLAAMEVRTANGLRMKLGMDLRVEQLRLKPLARPFAEQCVDDIINVVLAVKWVSRFQRFACDDHQSKAGCPALLVPKQPRLLQFRGSPQELPTHISSQPTIFLPKADDVLRHC